VTRSSLVQSHSVLCCSVLHLPRQCQPLLRTVLRDCQIACQYVRPQRLPRCHLQLLAHFGLWTLLNSAVALTRTVSPHTRLAGWQQLVERPHQTQHTASAVVAVYLRDSRQRCGWMRILEVVVGCAAQQAGPGHAQPGQMPVGVAAPALCAALSC
jgi:hypothetical protein